MNTIILTFFFVAAATANVLPIGIGNNVLVRDDLLGGINNVLVRDDVLGGIGGINNVLHNQGIRNPFVQDESILFNNNNLLRNILLRTGIKQNALSGLDRTNLVHNWWNPISQNLGTGQFFFNRLGLTQNQHIIQVIDTNIRMKVNQCINNGNDIDTCKHLGVKMVAVVGVKMNLDNGILHILVKNLVTDIAARVGMDIFTVKHVVHNDIVRLHILLAKIQNEDWDINTDNNVMFTRNLFGLGNINNLLLNYPTGVQNRFNTI